MCQPIKSQLIVVGEDEESKPSLSDVSSEVVANLRLIVRKSKELLTKGTKENDPEAFEHGVEMSIKAGNTAAKVLESARKLQTDGLAAIRVMSFVERCELFLGWFADLPPPYRNKVREGMEKFELDQGKPVPALVSAVE